MRAVEVKRGQLEGIVTATGTTFARAEVKIMPQIDGEIAKITVREGSRVERGQLLIHLEDTIARHQAALAKAELAAARARLRKLQTGSLPEEIKRAQANVRQRQAMLKRAEAEVASARAKLSQAQVNLQAFGDLHKQGVVSEQLRLNWQTQVDTSRALVNEKRSRLGEEESQLAAAGEQLALVTMGARSEDIDVARSEMRRAEANDRLLQTRLRFTRIVSPIDGIVSARLVEEGDLATPGKHLLTIIDASELRVRSPVSEIDLPTLRVGQDVGLSFDAYPRETFQGLITMVFPTVDPVSRNGTVEVVLPNADGKLRTGLFARLRMSLGKRAPALLIPQSAVRRSGEITTVFVLDRVGPGGPPGGGKLAAPGAGPAAAGPGGRPQGPIYKVRRLNVEVGFSQNDTIEVVRGLKENQLVLVSGLADIPEGASVRVRK